MKFLSLLFLLILSGYLAFIHIQPGHDWGGDFSLYIRQSQSLSGGETDRIAGETRFMIENSTDHNFSPQCYPWGFPVLLWPITAAHQTSGYYYAPGPQAIAHMKYLLAGCLMLFGFLYFRWLGLTFQGWIPLMATGFVLLQQAFCDHINSVLSEIPYLCFLMASLLTIEYWQRYWQYYRKYYRKGYPKEQRQFFRNQSKNPFQTEQELLGLPVIAGLFCTGVLLFFTAQIRTEGYLLFGALAATQAYEIWQHRKEGQKFSQTEWLYLGIPYAGVVLSMGVWSAILPSGFLSHFHHAALMNPETLRHNALSIIRGIEFFLPIPIVPAKWIFIGIMLLGWVRHFFHHIAPAVMMALTLALFLIWPHFESRYLFSLIPFVIFFFMKGVETISNTQICGSAIAQDWLLPGTITLLFALQILFAASMIYSYQGKTRPEIQGPYLSSSQEMFSYIRKNTEPTDVVAFFRPRVMSLFAQRKSLALFGEFTEITQKAQWYVVTLDQGSFYQHNETELKRHRRYLKETYRNANFIVYQVISNPPPQ